MSKKFFLSITATAMATLIATAVVADWKWRFSVTDRLARIETKLEQRASEKSQNVEIVENHPRRAD